MGYGRGKDSKSKKSKKKKEEEPSSSSESDSDQSYSSDSSYTSSSDSEAEQSKKKKVDSSTKKKQKKNKRKEEKRKKKEAKNKICKDDFYHKSTEFRLWLVEEKNKYFDQLSSSKSKAYFKKFVKQWNNRKLAKKYYKGIDMADARASLTKYKWKFAEKMKKSDTATPSPGGKVPSGWKSTPTAMSPPQRTFSTFGKAESSGTIGPSLPVKGPTLQTPAFSTFGRAVSTESIGPSRPVQGPTMPPTLSQVEEEDLRDAKRRQLRKERKDFRDHHKMVLDELSPKATGHDAKIEKKIARAQNRRSRGDSPDADSSYMGTTGDDIQRRLASRQAQRDQKRVQASAKIEEYQAREKAKMSKLLELARANKSKDALW